MLRIGAHRIKVRHLSLGLGLSLSLKSEICNLKSET